MIIEDLFIQNGAIQTGKFTLSNGQISDIYADCRKLLMNNCSAALIAEQLFKQIKEEFAKVPFETDRPPCVIAGVAEGGIPLVASVLTIACSDLQSSWRGGWVRKQAKLHGLGGQIAGCLQAGDTVILLEDVITSGESASKAIKILLKEGMRIQAVLAILDRSEGKNPFAQMDVEFKALTTLGQLRKAFQESQSHSIGQI